MTRQAKHTAGPWSIAGRYRSEVDGNEQHNVNVYGADTHAGGYRMNVARLSGAEQIEDEIEGNARLIAAAPELLAELKACVAIMVRAVGESLPIQQGTLCEEQDWKTTLRLARAVIAKVETVT